MAEFRIRRSDERSTTVVAFEGDVDLSAQDEAVAALESVLTPGREVRLDLRGVSFLDSTGLHVLVRAVERARAVGAQMSILPPTGRARQVLEMTGLDRILPLEPGGGAG